MYTPHNTTNRMQNCTSHTTPLQKRSTVSTSTRTTTLLRTLSSGYQPGDLDIRTRTPVQAE
eukprot:1890778-Amphidinium_carterae.3